MSRPDARPNVVLILADDMGFSDIGCYGGEIRTPNLDALAASGVRLTQMYNAARCCPSRAALLTGLYPHQTGVGHMILDLGHPSYQGYLNDRCVTIAEALRTAGYRTYLSGKWHVGGSFETNPDDWKAGQRGYPIPVQRGFDQHYGTLAGAGSYYLPHALIRDDEFVQPEGTAFYYTDAIGENAVAMIGDAAARQQPFFLHVAFTAPHWPLHALEEDVARYRGRYRAGWDELRRERLARLRDLGLLADAWDLSPRDASAPAWEAAPNQEWEAERMAVYAAQVDRMDQTIGKIVDALSSNGLLDNTLILFLSDNGGCAEFLGEDGWVRTLCSPVTPDGRPVRVGNIPGLMPGGPDTYQSYDLPWANASNTPFRLYKHWVHEGGISTPFIAHWPTQLPAGQIRHEPCHLIDIMATCLEAAGASYPTDFNGQAITPLEGENLLPLLRGGRWERQRSICWEHEGNRAIRCGRWKLVSKHPGPWELFDMDRDRTELQDLAKAQAAKIHELATLYEAWAERVGVRPWPEIRKARRPRG